MSDYYLVTTVSQAGGFWSPSDIFSDANKALDHADELMTLASPPYGVAVFPIKLDWTGPCYKRYRNE